MQLSERDITTREVLDWKGIHLFHAPGSSCSQKVRIYLNIKDVEWTSHPVNLMLKENISSYYLGINPRGLVPCLIDDGAVHIESNDILVHLESRFPEPSLIPAEHNDSVSDLLRHEDNLHMALRTVTFRFMMPTDEPPKTAQDLERYANQGSGTVGGVADAARDREIAFWRNMLDGGISDEAARAAVAEFRAAFEDLEQRLAGSSYILGNQLSVLDIAWVIYVNRLALAGYPLEHLHPRLAAWAATLKSDPAFAPEMALPPPFAARVAAHQEALAQAGRSLSEVCGLTT
ncbi:glutathione S-transferase family protein [Novosphingobium pentaromativorans]|uniref:Glutathione S-transferase n=1 Tax=Novosphingobium pentaromativorans US6-1 TaxID=1088721 RepID=G6EFL4_9SPHN|nr:glutathione S-transferase family protein [Novosphingobium pentaromativorans]EHJ59885.1 hypothetical protein NSU_3135 [Novosphingobium pentaromativorans US6-1]